MIYSYHAFADEAAYLAVASPPPPAAADIDVIGAVGGEWLVNAAWLGEVPEEWSASRVYPTTPVRMFAGAPAPDAPAPSEPVPQSVALWRARAVLKAADLDDAVTAELAGDVAASEWWERGEALDREHPRTAALAALLGLTSDQVDDLFRQAAALTV